MGLGGGAVSDRRQFREIRQENPTWLRDAQLGG
jgi:hypothetical protein